MLLEGLGRVDWEHVEHAYGPATDVPGWLRALAGDDANARRKALTDLDSAVNHQGWSTPASVPTTPFLVELLQAGIERAALALRLGFGTEGKERCARRYVYGKDKAAFPFRCESARRSGMVPSV